MNGPEPSVSIDHSTRTRAEVLSLLARVATATLSAQLHKRGYTTATVEGVRTDSPGIRMVGVAQTLRLIPYRPDLFELHGGGYNAQKGAFDSLSAGDVLVIEARGDVQAGTLGDVLAARAEHLGAAGIVTDGCVRDAAAIRQLRLPVFSRASHPALISRRHVPWAVGETISCGGAAVVPGDVIVGDDDGVLVIPQDLAVEVGHAAVMQELEESFISEMVARGERLDGLYPMNPEWRERFEFWRQAAPRAKESI